MSRARSATLTPPSERATVLRRFYRALDATEIAGDRTEARIERRLQVAMAVLSVPLIGAWGLLFVLGGHAEVAVWSLGYIAGTLALLAGVAVTGRFGVLRVPHVVLVGAGPVATTIYLGGFEQSGGAMLWTLLVPFAAMMFRLRGRSAYFIAVALASVLVVLLHRDGAGVLSPRELELHWAFNTIGFTGFLFVSLRYFVARIDQEKARAEELLGRVLPAPIVRRLKRDPGVIADHLPAVTVVFADLVGFTPLAAKLTPETLVQLLDEVFSAFDKLAASHGVEKIKTIGDAYMAVAGAPEPCADHADRAARLALAMRAHVRALATARDMELAMRIGLHTGEAVAGVIGIERFAYDLWGDTVNTASRMESHGQPNAIQLTKATRDALGAGFVTRERGPIEVKGRGTIVTYWLDG